MAYYYIYDGIISNGLTLSSGTYMFISSGGVANDTTVNSYGAMYISSGGTANSTTVNDYGYMYISSGGVHRGSLQIESGATVSAYSGAIFDFTVADRKTEDGYLINNLSLIQGAPTYTVTVSAEQEFGTYKLAQGAEKFNGTISITDGLNEYGAISVNENLIYGKNLYTIVQNNGNLTLRIEKNPTVFIFNNYGALISSGFTISGVTLMRYNPGVSMYVSSGGTANDTVVNSSGYMHIFSGGVANNTTVNSSGYMFISSGGEANNTIVNSYGSMCISSDGEANYTTVNSYGCMSICSNGVANHTTMSKSSMYISGGTANSTTVTSGSMYIFCDGEANNTIINSMGFIGIGNWEGGGTANSTTVNSGGYMYISTGGIAYNTIIDGGVMSTLAGGTANSTTVNYWGRMYISTGTANSTTVNSGGYMEIGYEYYGGGTANYTTVNSSGSMTITSGGTANFTTVNSSGYMRISSGGVANSTTVNDGGHMYISSGGVANSTTINYYGYIYISSGGTANSTTVNSGGAMRIHPGGTANSTTVNSGGIMLIFSGGTATNVIWTPCVGRVSAADGAYVTYTSKYSGVYFGSNNQLLSHTQSMSGKVVSGSMYVMSGGVANCTTVNYSGYMYIYSGGVANSTTVNGWGSMYISSGGVANNITVNSRGRMYIFSGGTASNTIVNSSGRMEISSGGVANSTTVNSGGAMYICSGGTANSTTVNSRGYMSIDSGGVHRGSLQIESGATVSAYSGAKIDFNVADRNTEDGYLINDLSLISGAPTYTITVSAEQEFGTYKLAQGASNFTDTLTIGDGTVDYGSITVNGEDFVYNDTVYSLDQVDGNLSLTIDKAPDIIPPELTITGNATTPTNQDVVLKISANENCTILYNIDNGEWQTYSDCITVTANGTVNIKATDEAGNVTEKSVIIDKIDKIAPNKPTAFADTTELTNQNVAISATFSSDSVVKKYSLDNRTWKTYTSAVVMSTNGTVYFRGQDEAGNYSEVTSFNVTNIDKVAPTLEISGNATVPTNQDVVLTATASDGTVEYFANGKWNKGNSIIATENGTFKFRVTDEAGNVTEKSVVVDKIDKVAPTLEISGNVDAPTNQNVVLTATASDGTVEYFANGKWNKGNSITATDNGTYKFRVTDAAGNVTEKSIVVDMIDKVAPTLEISGNVDTPTNKDVVLTAAASDGTVEYYDGAKWIEGNKLTVISNGTYQFRVTDAAGNITEKSVVVDKIDKVAPTLEISGNATAPTNKDIVLTATASDGTVEYFANGKWNSGNSLPVAENGTYQFRVTDAAGNVTEKSVTVDMIDKVAPILEISGNATAPTNKDIILTATASDGTVEYFNGKDWVEGNSITATENGTYQFRVTDEAGNITEKSVVVDMIDKVAPTLEISGNVTAPTNKDVVLTATVSDGTVEYYDGAEWIEGNKLTVSENGTYQFRVTDAAGNITEKSVTVDMIDKVAPTLEISGNVDAPTNKDVVLTATASDGTVEYFANDKWNIGSSLTVTTNGTYQFRVTDIAGNVTEKSVSVDMIDKVAPTLEISGNVDTPTNKDVVLTATASDGTIEYFANGKWNKGNSITATDNGTYKFRVTDAAGNVTEKSVTVDMIDKVAPTLEINGNVDAPTNKDVVLTATASDGTVEYFANGKWNSGNSLTVAENGTYQFRVTDEAGNVTEKSVTVDMIDKVAPTLEISGNVDTPTNQDVVLTAIASDGTVEYFANDKWNIGSSLTVTTNGTYQFRVTDEAGNVTEKSVTVDMIDKIAPNKPSAVADITTATNQNVTVSAVFSSDSVVKQYSLDNRTWQSYTSGVVMEDNGTVYFRGKDEAGNYSTVVSYTVNNIDKVAPTLEINGNPTMPTNQDVVLTATASDGAIEYFANGKWNKGNSITATNNGTYKFRVTDEAGNVSEKSVTVDMIDKVAPTLEISGNATAPTNQDVVLTATASDGAIEYFANGKWNKGNTITASENGTFKFRVTDAAGNITEKSVVVDMIDKVAPTLEISGNAEVPTNQDVILTAIASDGTIEYFEDGKWNKGNTITASENGTFKFRVTDAAGNITEKSVVVDMIDKVAPTLEISGNAEVPTNQDVVLTATASDGTVEYFANGKWNKGNSIIATENGTFKFRVTDAAGNVTEKSVVVDQIDKVAPTLEINGNVDAPTNEDVVLTATASDGTIEYFADGKWNIGNLLTVTTNGTYQFRVTDAAGNVTEKSVVVDMIDKVAPTLEISGNATEPTNKDVVLTATASDGTVEYFNGKDWVEGNSITATENGTYQFRVTDEAGNVAEKSVVVDKIDKVAPVKPSVSTDITAETKNAVTVSATFSGDSVVKQYSLDNKTWQKYTSGVVMESNGTVYFRGIDAAGNVSQTAVYEVNNIIAAPDVIDGDLDGNGYADTILVHTKQGYSGAWLTTGDASVIKWGSLSDVKSGIEILGTGTLYGSENDGQDIFFADSKSVGAWNVVDGKVTGYKSIMSVNSTTNVLGLGDFNGDGATDLLLRSTSGDLGFYGTDGTGWEYLIGLGKEWSVAAVGDLNGDGLADTIVRHDAGFAGTFLTQTDGTVKWANLDTLAKDMTIVGTGDFNGDGVDDVLLQKDDGWIGAWLVEDGSVDSFMGICTNKSAIEQIADFNGDGIDDLRVRDGNAIGVLYVNGADSTTWQYFQSVGTEWDTSFAALA